MPFLVGHVVGLWWGVRCWGRTSRRSHLGRGLTVTCIFSRPFASLHHADGNVGDVGLVTVGFRPTGVEEVRINAAMVVAQFVAHFLPCLAPVLVGPQPDGAPLVDERLKAVKLQVFQTSAG